MGDGEDKHQWILGLKGLKDFSTFNWDKSYMITKRYSGSTIEKNLLHMIMGCIHSKYIQISNLPCCSFWGEHETATPIHH